MIMIYSNGITRYILFNTIHFLIFYEITFNVFWKSKISEYNRALRNSISLTFLFRKGSIVPVHQITINQNPLERAACKVAPRSCRRLNDSSCKLLAWTTRRDSGRNNCMRFAVRRECVLVLRNNASKRSEIRNFVRGVRYTATIILNDGNRRLSSKIGLKVKARTQWKAQAVGRTENNNRQ